MAGHLVRSAAMMANDLTAGRRDGVVPPPLRWPRRNRQAGALLAGFALAS